jgi:quercetin dioxygenase-like cupin family protein
MKVVKISGEEAKEESRALFIGGKVYLQMLVDKNDSEQYGSAVVTFGPGGRTRLHTHQSNQILFATKGKGIVGTDKEQHVVTPGTLVLIPANQPHWHGATSDESFSHLSVVGPSVTQIVE